VLVAYVNRDAEVVGFSGFSGEGGGVAKVGQFKETGLPIDTQMVFARIRGE